MSENQGITPEHLRNLGNIPAPPSSTPMSDELRNAVEHIPACKDPNGDPVYLEDVLGTVDALDFYDELYDVIARHTKEAVERAFDSFVDSIDPNDKWGVKTALISDLKAYKENYLAAAEQKRGGDV